MEQQEKTIDDYRMLALARLSVREYAAAEMRSYLVRKGAKPADAELIVEELIGSERLDDRRYARAVTRHQAFRDKGPSYIQQKLRQKGVKISLPEVRGIFKETLPESYESELDMARKVLERRYPRAMPGPEQDRDEMRRAYQALIRRGFSSEVAKKCVFRSAADLED